MEFITKSGSRYKIEGDIITRLAEHPILDRFSLQPLDIIISSEKMEWFETPVVGQSFRCTLNSGGSFTTTEIVEVK